LHSELLRQSGPAGRRRRPLSASSDSSLEDSLPSLLGLGAQSKRRKLNENIDNDVLIKEFYIEESKLLKNLTPHKNIIKFVEVLEDPEYNDSIFIGNYILCQHRYAF
jgi:hypothetical protein